MALFDINEPIKLNEDIVCLIKRRWLQIWVHSFIYYKMGTSIISDTMWDKLAKELVELKDKYPNEAKSIKHYDIFADFDGSTGFIIASKATPNLIKKAKQLVEYKEKHKC